jgi:hypothetical protein
MSTYSLSDLIDKTMIAKKDSVSNVLDNSQSEIFANYKKGDTIGKVYSYTKKGGKTWLMFYENGKAFYFDLTQPNAIDKTVLSEQGVLTVPEKAEAEAEKNKDYFTRIYESIFNIALLAAAVYLINTLIIKKA